MRNVLEQTPGNLRRNRDRRLRKLSILLFSLLFLGSACGSKSVGNSDTSALLDRVSFGRRLVYLLDNDGALWAYAPKDPKRPAEPELKKIDLGKLPGPLVGTGLAGNSFVGVSRDNRFWRLKNENGSHTILDEPVQAVEAGPIGYAALMKSGKVYAGLFLPLQHENIPKGALIRDGWFSIPVCTEFNDIRGVASGMRRFDVRTWVVRADGSVWDCPGLDKPAIQVAGLANIEQIEVFHSDLLARDRAGAVWAVYGLDNDPPQVAILENRAEIASGRMPEVTHLSGAFQLYKGGGLSFLTEYYCVESFADVARQVGMGSGAFAGGWAPAARQGLHVARTPASEKRYWPPMAAISEGGLSPVVIQFEDGRLIDYRPKRRRLWVATLLDVEKGIATPIDPPAQPTPQQTPSVRQPTSSPAPANLTQELQKIAESFRADHAVVAQLRRSAGMTMEQPGPIPGAAGRNPKALENIRQKVDTLDQIVAKEPVNANAMAYLNLYLRQLADFSNSEQDYRTTIAKAEAWMQKSVKARGAK